MLSGTRGPCDAGVIAAADGRTPCPERTRPWVLATSILGSSLAFIDGSVVNVALPAMQADLGVDVRLAQWFANAYLLTLSALILVGGAAGDRLGRWRVFVAGVALFTLASLACALSPNAEVLIAARALQGVGAALLVPTSLALISAAYPPAQRGRAIGTWAGASALTTALGPVLGGWLVDAWSWHAIFFINLPLGALALAIAQWRVPESRVEGAGRIDWMGGALATLALAGIALGLTSAVEHEWTSLPVMLPLFAGTALGVAFVAWQARARSPMVPLALFASRNFSAANAITLLLYAALGGVLFFLPFALIRVHGFSAAQAGAAFLPFSLIMGFLSRWSGGLVERHGARLPLTVGPVVTAVGYVWLALPDADASYWTTFLPATVVLGIGMTVSVAPLTTAVMSALDDRHAGVASGVNNAVARVASLLAIALMAVLAVGAYRASLSEHLDVLDLAPAHRAGLLAQAADLAESAATDDGHAGTTAAVDAALRESFVPAFRAIALAGAALSLLSGLVAWLAIRDVPPRGGGVDES